MFRNYVVPFVDRQTEIQENIIRNNKAGLKDDKRCADSRNSGAEDKCGTKVQRHGFVIFRTHANINSSCADSLMNRRHVQKMMSFEEIVLRCF